MMRWAPISNSLCHFAARAAPPIRDPIMSKTNRPPSGGRVFQNQIVVRAGFFDPKSSESPPLTWRIDLEWLSLRTGPTASVRKEVIQPQVPLRLPCYDFAPVTGHTMGGCLPCGLARRLPVQQAS